MVTSPQSSRARRPIRCAAIMMAALSGCGWMCSFVIEQEVPSPDGRYVARELVRNCHATVPYSTVLRLEDQHATVFRQTDVDIGGCGQPLRLSWITATELLVEYPPEGSKEHCRFVPMNDRWRSVTYRVRPNDRVLRSPSGTTPDNIELQRTKPAQAMELRR
jgi:hypothetical protein